MFYAEVVYSPFFTAANRNDRFFAFVLISIGVAHMIPSTDTTPGLLIHMADQALYQVKNKGRNIVVENKESA